MHRNPLSVLAAVLDQPDAVDNRSATATAEESAQQTAAVRTPGELLADAAQLAATERTCTWLEQLTDQGLLTPAQRSVLAAEDGAATLTRILRRTELAGLDPRQVLRDAVADRPLTGSRTLSNVLYARIRQDHEHDLAPIGDRWADWVPRIDNPTWRGYLDTLAAAADRRAAELGRDAAAQPAGWILDSLGPPPPEGAGRAQWERKVATVAAYRELRGHTNPTDALGAPPPAGHVEAHAAYQAAWRALGRPEADREELEMSDGQLLMRVRAAEREEKWAPRFVGHELAGTRQAADHHRHTAALRAAEAHAATDPPAARLHREAEQASALATVLDTRAGQLQEIDDARAVHLAHTAGTRVRGERSQAELDRRHVDDPTPEPRVTAEEWLAADQADRHHVDPYRDITDTDITDQDTADTGHDRADRDSGRADWRDAPETAVADIRDIAAGEPAPRREDEVRVPTAAETDADLRPARRALAEINTRQVYDAEHDDTADHHSADWPDHGYRDDYRSDYRGDGADNPVGDTDRDSDHYDPAGVE